MLHFAQHDKVEDSKPHPLVPLLQQGEGRFGESQNRVRSCHDAKCHSEHSEESSADVKAARRSVGQSGDGKPHPLVPLLL